MIKEKKNFTTDRDLGYVISSFKWKFYSIKNYIDDLKIIEANEEMMKKKYKNDWNIDYLNEDFLNIKLDCIIDILVIQKEDENSERQKIIDAKHLYMEKTIISLQNGGVYLYLPSYLN